jgi:Pilus assembly protein, PilO
MSKLPTNARIALMVAGIVVALLGGWFTVIAPKRKEVTLLKQQIDETQSKIAEAQGAKTPSGPPPIRVADLFRLSRAMPNTADMPGVILQLSRVAQETGVSFESITPHSPVAYGAYQQVSVDLTFEGRFYDLSDFLYRLRNLVSVRAGVLNATGRLFTVDSIRLDQGAATFPQVKATLTVSAYIFGDGTAPPVPAGAEPTDSTTPSTPAAGSTQPIPAAPVA